MIVSAGGGGVGKTTTSAALALALARTGSRALIVTIDPARRLADAMGVELGTEVQDVPLTVINGRPGKLLALMPEPQRAMRLFVESLFEGQAEALERLLGNRLYQVLEEAVPGIHELVAMNLVNQAVVEHQVDVVVIDTAPSRHALDFVSYPRRLAKLLGGRAVGWLARIAQRGAAAQGAAPSEPHAPGRVERLVVGAIGPAVYDVAHLFTEMARVLPRFIELNKQTARLLLGPNTRYLLVAAPTGAARQDAAYLRQRLRALELSPVALVVNAATAPTPPWADLLATSEEATAPMRQALQILAAERDSRMSAALAAVEAFTRIDGNLPQVRLSFVAVADPRIIVQTLAGELEGHLQLLIHGRLT